jgi:hypothetical protein
VGLRVEEDLHVDDLVGGGALEVGQHQIVEVFPGAQHVGTGVIQVEKALQAVEGVGGAQGGLVGIRQGDAVAAGQGEGQVGLQGAFNMQVKLGLGHAEGDVEGVRCGHGISRRLRNTRILDAKSKRAQPKPRPNTTLRGETGYYLGMAPSTPST